MFKGYPSRAVQPTEIFNSFTKPLEYKHQFLGDFVYGVLES